MTKPKYFIVKRDNSNPLWKEYIKWLNEIYDTTWTGDSYVYYGYDGGNKYNGTIYYNIIEDCINNPVVLTLEEWESIFISKPENIHECW